VIRTEQEDAPKRSRSRLRDPRALPATTVQAPNGLAHSTRYGQAPLFEATFSAAPQAGPMTGRLLLILAREARMEPPSAVPPRGSASSAIDVDQLAPGQPAIVDAGAVAHPVGLSDAPRGDYYAQVVIRMYVRLQRGDGHPLCLPMTDGTISAFTAAPGSMYSTPHPVRVGEGGTVRIDMSQVVPPARRWSDTKWLEHVLLESPMLAAFAAPSSSMRLSCCRRGAPIDRACAIRRSTCSATAYRSGSIPTRRVSAKSAKSIR
jgi:hypothetical protein